MVTLTFFVIVKLSLCALCAIAATILEIIQVIENSSNSAQSTNREFNDHRESQSNHTWYLCMSGLLIYKSVQQSGKYNWPWYMRNISQTVRYNYSNNKR